MNAETVLLASWIGFLCGFLSGIVPGLLFHNADWLGGYSSWSRRLIRLGHISFFGIGLVNLGFALTMRSLGISDGLAIPSALFIAGAVTMPLLCYLSAWRSGFRHLFFIPVLSLAIAVALTLARIWPT